MTLLGVLACVVFLETGAVMALWGSRAPWWRWPAGRSIMALLSCVLLISGLATASWLFGPYPGQRAAYGASYVALILAIAGVGGAILAARRDGRD